MDTNKRLRWSRRLSFVPRWSIVPTVRQQTVDAHSFHVTHTALWLLEKHVLWDQPEFVMAVVRYALDHDIDEAATGDAPTPGKTWKRPEEMNDVQIVVKCADILEAMAFMFEENALGNGHGVVAILKDLEKRLDIYWPHFELRTGWRGMTTVELIRTYRDQIVPPHGPLSHPGLEK